MALPEEIQQVPSTDSSSPHSSYHDPSPTPSYVDAYKRKTSERRYATYELNWNSSSAENNSSDDDEFVEFVDPEDHISQINDHSEDSAQVARRSVQSASSTQPSVPLTHQQDHPMSQPSSTPSSLPRRPTSSSQPQRPTSSSQPQRPTSSSQPQRPTSSAASSKKSVNPITINTSVGVPEERDDNKSPQSPFGGITVTTVKVVEVLHSPTKDNTDIDSSSKVAKRPSQTTKGDSGQRKRQQQWSLRPVSSKNSSNGVVMVEQKRKRHPVSSPPIPVVPPARVVNHGQVGSKIRQELMQRSSVIPNSMQNQKKRTSIMSPLKGKGLNRNVSNVSKGKQPNVIVPREMAFIDPRLIAKRSLVRTQSVVRNNTAAGKSIKRGASILKKRVPPRNMEFAPTSNPVHSNDPTDMESDIMPRRTVGLPWLPGPPKPPKLLHASLVPLPNRAQRAASTNPNRTSRIVPTNPDRTSRILSTVTPKRNSRRLSTTFPNNNVLARANSLRRRSSALAPLNKRASLDFRRKLLEESIMSSFGGAFNAQPQVHPKQPIRRKTKKGSNAKLEDRETRRERRRERREKKLAEKDQQVVTDNDQGEVVGAKNAVKRLERTRIISSQELLKKVEEEENRKKENLNGPQPPPRRSPNEVISPPEYHPPVRSRSNTLSLLSSPPERRPSKPESNSDSPQSSEPPPFPAHLSRPTTFAEHNRLQFPSGTSPPISSSRMAPAPPEESDRPSKNDDDAHSYSPAQSPRTQKLGIFGGLFNKQVAGSTGISLIPSPPTTYTVQPPLLIPTRSAPPPPVSSPPPQIPPLNPLRTQKVQSQLPRLSKNRHMNETDQFMPNQEKLRKMEQFEALIAGSEQSTSKKSKPGKISALTNLIMTNNIAASSSSSSANITSSTTSAVDRKKKTADGPPEMNGRRQSGEVSSGSSGNSERRGDGLKPNPDAERLSIEKDSTGRSSLNSLAVSVADSIHYRPEERDVLGKPGAIGEDGVIRVTLTPAVCR